MKKFILAFKTHFKKLAIATMFLFAMAFWLVFLTGCNSNLFSADLEETTRSNISQVIQNEPVVFAETQASTKTSNSMVVKNEKGQIAKTINSGSLLSQVRASSSSGINDRNVLLSKGIGNVFVSGDNLIDFWDSKNTTGECPFFYVTSVGFDISYFNSQLEGTQSWEYMYDIYEYYEFGIYGFDKTKTDFSDFIYFEFEEYFNKYDFDIIYTSYTWEELDLTAPTINGTTHVSIDVDNQPSIDEIISHVYAYDETDGYVPVLVESSTYVQGVMEVGDYTINIYALDKASNRNDTIIYAHRYDWTSPTISGTDSYDLNYDNDLTLAKIESALTITDNVDSGLKLEKVSDTFTGNEHKLGNYQVVYRAKDRSNNVSANKTINIAIKNKGTAVIGGAREIKVGTNKVLTLEEFKSNVSVVDGYDGIITNYTIEGFDDYTATSKVVGTNIIKVSYTNSGNNTALAEYSIIKEDKLIPNFLFDNYFLQLKQGEVFTLDMIMNHVALVLNVDIAQIDSVSGEYDVMTLGNYGIDVCMATGEKKTFTLSVVDEFGQTPSDKVITKDFLSTEGYVDNLFKPNNWSVYHYLTILGIALVIIGIISFCVVHKKRNKNQNSMYY
ncbi:MAG: hypothetical protein NC310_02000 [Roseburia sp.]|nr:hypothetical protein [Roseburia sp.]MCM1556298.1 hypothetical protein [Anaeroplasma bactoclasticum]